MHPSLMDKCLGDLDKNQIQEVLKECISQFKMGNLLAQEPFMENWEFKLKPRFKTAAWFYKEEVHYLILGTDCFSRLDKSTAVPKLIKHGLRLLRHEEGHARYTIKDLAHFKKLLAKKPKDADDIDVPFKVGNLGEDARIEESQRKLHEHPFDWLDVEKLEMDSNAFSMLFSCIQADGQLEIIPVQEGFLEKFKDVSSRYKEMAKAKSTEELVPLLKSFFKKYGHEWKESKSDNPEDLSLSLVFAQAPSEVQEQMIQELLDPEAEEDSEKEDKALNSSTPLLELPYGLSTIDKVLVSRLTEPLDPKKTAALAKSMQRVFLDKKKLKLTHEVGKKLDVLGMALDSEKPYFKELGQGKKKKKIALFVDLSGSMAGPPSQGGAYLLSILNYLCAQKYVQGFVCFAAGQRNAAAQLPLPPKYVELLQGYAGYEGLEPAIEQCKKELASCDHVFVYTDADIVDRPINKQSLQLHGIFTTGLYVGEGEETRKDALKYFDKAISAPTIEKLIDALVTSIL